MALASRLEHAPPAGLTRRQASGAILALILLFAVIGFLAGHETGRIRPVAPIEGIDRVPVGIEHSPAGALAAADNYVAVEQQSVERDPARFATLVATAYEPVIRSASLRAAQADRDRDAAGMALWARGAQSYTVIGAHRLDSYRADLARVTTWAGQVYWGPGDPPTQTWALAQTSLVWAHGRWWVSAMETLSEPAPSVAALPQAAPGNDSAAGFDALLGGFTPVGYGPAGG